MFLPNSPISQSAPEALRQVIHVICFMWLRLSVGKLLDESRATFRMGLMMGDFTHFDDKGASRMVDVGEKPATLRFARASAVVSMSAGTLTMLRDRKMAKGDVLEVARLSGIMAAKQTATLIPLCHPISLDSVELSFEFLDESSVAIESIARVTAKTGVEMEALVAVSTAALTIYDMCKSVDRAMSIQQIQLEEKSGGKSGHFLRKEPS